MEIVWLQLALEDLAFARAYISQENPYAANMVAQRIIQSVRLLSDTPHIGRPGRVPNTRELVVTNTPFIIPYRVYKNRVEILRVYHGAQQIVNRRAKMTP